MCIENMMYGDGESEGDYSDKFFEHMKNLGLNARGVSAVAFEKGPCMHDVKFSSLSIKLHQPYWLLHQGTCEHFIVFEEMRAPFSDDTLTQYPVTHHITPIGSASDPLCQACAKVPAVYAIVNDIRLAQSPCRLCIHCWNRMGIPGAAPVIEGEQHSDKDKILVVPLPNYVHGRSAGS